MHAFAPRAQGVRTLTPCLGPLRDCLGWHVHQDGGTASRHPGGEHILRQRSERSGLELALEHVIIIVLIIIIYLACYMHVHMYVCVCVVYTCVCTYVCCPCMSYVYGSRFITVFIIVIVLTMYLVCHICMCTYVCVYIRVQACMYAVYVCLTCIRAAGLVSICMPYVCA